MPKLDLNGKVALVTGAAQGIGFETARRMQLRGAAVAVVDLAADRAAAAAERIGPGAIGIAADVTDQGAMQAAVAETVEKLGGLDVAVANAGIFPAKMATVHGASADEWERVVDVNLLGAWRTARATLPQIVERGGQIALVSSVYAFLNGMGNSSYSVSKAGIESLGRSMRAELAPRGAGATVAYFGFIDTDMLQELMQRPEAGRIAEFTPAWMMKSITPAEAAAGLVAGIEERAPRVFMPRWWRYVSALRGVLNPLLDRRMEHDETVAALLREID